MPKKSVEEQPSTTALFTALRRALIYLAFKDEKFSTDNLAINFLPPHYRFFLRFQRVRDTTLDQLADALPGMNEYIIARTAYFDDLFLEALKKPIPQIVLLGAGYDSRAYRFATANTATQVFELDIAPTQNRKRQCLRKSRIEIPEWIKFVPINFNQQSLGEVLEQAGYDYAQPTLFTWEGVSYYLDPPSVDATLGFVSHAARGSLVAFDYMVNVDEEHQDKFYGYQHFAQAMSEYHENEALKFRLDEGEIGSFLDARGLKLVNHLDNQEIEKKYLARDDGSLLGQILGHLRLAIAAPEK